MENGIEENGTIVKSYVAYTNKGKAGILILKFKDSTYHSTAFLLSEYDNYNTHFNESSEEGAYEKVEKWVKGIVDNNAVFRLIPD